MSVGASLQGWEYLAFFSSPSASRPCFLYLQQAHDLAVLCVYWLRFVGFGAGNLVDLVALEW